MSKSLLLGNGINSRIGINGMSVREIKKRFRENVCKSSCVFESLFGVSIFYEVYDSIIDSNNYGIESLAGAVYKYIKSNTSIELEMIV